MIKRQQRAAKKILIRNLSREKILRMHSLMRNYMMERFLSVFPY